MTLLFQKAGNIIRKNFDAAPNEYFRYLKEGYKRVKAVLNEKTEKIEYKPLTEKESDKEAKKFKATLKIRIARFQAQQDKKLAIETALGIGSKTAESVKVEKPTEKTIPVDPDPPVQPDPPIEPDPKKDPAKTEDPPKDPKKTTKKASK